MGAIRWLTGGIAGALLMGCGPTLVPDGEGLCRGPGYPNLGTAPSSGTFTIVQYAKALREPWTKVQPTSSMAARLGTRPDLTHVSQPESVEAFRAELSQKVGSFHGRRSNEDVYQLQSMKWSQKYARAIDFTAIDYTPRMEVRWQLYGRYFLSGATAGTPGSLMMSNWPLE